MLKPSPFLLRHLLWVMLLSTGAFGCGGSSKTPIAPAGESTEVEGLGKADLREELEKVVAGKTLQAWATMLKSGDALQQEVAGRVIARAGPAARSALPALLEATAEEKFAFAGVFGARGTSLFEKIVLAAGNEGVPQLRKMLSHAKPAVRIQAAKALEHLGPDARVALPELVKLLEESVPLRYAAWRTLRAIGPGAAAALPYLTQSMRDRDGYIRFGAAGTVLHIDPDSEPALQILFEGMRDNRIDGRERAVARMALESIKPPPRNYVRRLINWLEGADYPKASEAFDKLVKMGPAAKDAIPALIRKVRAAKNWEVKRLHMVALPAIEPDNKEVVALLREMLPTPPELAKNYQAQGLEPPSFDPSVVAALAKTGAKWRETVVPLLRPGLTSKSFTDRLGISFAILCVKPNDPKSIEVLVDTYFSDDKVNVVRLREPAFHQLMDRSALPILRAAFKKRSEHQHQRLVLACLIVFFEPNDKEMIDVIVANASTRDAFSISELADRLATIGPSAVPTLREMIKRPGFHHRMAALQILARFGSDAEAAIPTLVELLQNADHPELAYQAIRVLKGIGPKAREALSALDPGLKHPSLLMRLIATQAIHAIDPTDKRVVPALLDTAKKLEKYYEEATKLKKNDFDALGNPVTIAFRPDFKRDLLEFLIEVDPESALRIGPMVLGLALRADGK